MHRQGDPNGSLTGPGSLDDLQPGLDPYDIRDEDIASLWNSLGEMCCTTPGDAMPKPNLEPLLWTPLPDIPTETTVIQPPGSAASDLSKPSDSLEFTCQLGLPNTAAVLACSCESALSSIKPAQDIAAMEAHPRMLAMHNAAATSLRTPIWAEAGFLGGAQRAAASWGAGALTPDPLPALAAPLLPTRPIDFTQRTKAKVVALGATVGSLQDQKAALQRDVLSLLNHHVELSKDMPWHLQHEEVTFMAAIAKCMDCAVAKPATINKAVLTNSSSVNSLLVGANMGKSALPCSGQNAPPEQGSGEGILWSSILAFLRLSRSQKDSLAALYGAYLHQVEALRRDCLATSSRLEEGRLLQPTIATHHVCGQLTGIAMQGDDVIRRFTDDCCQVLNNVQLNNLHALAPAGTCALLGLCREVAASRSSTAAASNAPSSKKRRQS